MVSLLQVVSALALSAAMRPTHNLTEEAGDHLCCCQRWNPPVEICAKDNQAFAKVNLIDGVVEEPPWFNASITVHETWKWKFGGEILKEERTTTYFQLHYLGELEPPGGLGLGNPKFADFFYTEYQYHEKQGLNAKGADDFRHCTDRTYECSCEFFEGQERKDCEKSPAEHCGTYLSDCGQWVTLNKCTLSSDNSMKLMHKNSNQRVGTCFDKKTLKTKYMRAQCPEEHDKCDCNDKC
ncbi:unnamed protein product [Effrenium voratum]|uniref:Uncharacterized protein n=1 Tax=Effrenium voratum TaxID=2562239 RepID=A0AA36NJI2_9DINO|nr:unnamed protein product [Effrenium voratum]CAJ1409534.1 unnamed protein product [Effrenium voratum]CAJ1422939.1 unnamed protein product [Effrenium voratum]|mmetsp:Transcript_98354/g.234132  ORF Transcript_98354/g.234132 Transcript_98354/m.234132 type:complete len:238 (-) Transcript_98354:49-762(-)|eukprot:CAMPEP_0181451990 /NCGR_PEP_ID=MMETSP1110-20121109/28978_1 /TAXON_ID=174948 /ORGANISM="Symbiodinium sp., Strain CCMP421" /LENGTH=237 /DNA_ID=CAMNT_0023576263 /DNA_START=49 /DNA_END=762 /DNA_ORIENTATION=-